MKYTSFNGFFFNISLCIFLSIFFPFHVFSGYFEIEGLHRFKVGDDIQWSSPLYDDSNWEEIKKTTKWSFHGLKTLNGIVWHRFHFRGEILNGKPYSGIYLGRIGDADETFLNGVKIGGVGVVEDEFIEAPHAKRLYRVPEGFMILNGENVLAIRIMNTYLKGGLFEAGPLIGDYKDLLIEKKLSEQTHKNIEITLIMFMFLFLIFFLLAFISGMKQREYLSFGIFSAFYSILYFFDSGIFFDAGLKTHTIQKIIFFLTSLLVPGFLVFSMETLKERYGNIEKILIAFSLMISFVFLITMSWERYRLLVYLWIVMGGIVSGLVVFHLIKGFIKKTYASKELISIVLILTVAVVVWLGEIIGAIPSGYINGFSLSEFAVPLAMLLFLYSVCLRFSKTMEELKVFSSRIFTTHEIERKRISRDLHDGIGQSLSAIKLKLQMLNSSVSEENKKEKEIFKSLIENISYSIEELRNVAMDIRPSFLENVDLIEALKLHGDRFYKQTGIAIHIKIQSGCSMGLETRLRDNLYRIYQEALSNILKHSEATSVDVSLKKEGNILIMEIEDNGKGFEPKIPHKGIGLESMRERVALLDGDFEIKTSPLKGTKIKVMVPLR
ncbi:MAG: sensor histidine kinase [Syntrophorhabdaceae bacterium]|nr:sensor histidine kinase [Syntrophorhabdaceae bacterium]